LKSSLYAQEFSKVRDFPAPETIMIYIRSKVVFLTIRPQSSKEYTRTFYRPDLHNELKRLALSPPPGYPVPKLLLGSEVVAVVSLSST
jgi:hypothetical protein